MYAAPSIGHDSDALTSRYLGNRLPSHHRAHHRAGSGEVTKVRLTETQRAILERLDIGQSSTTIWADSKTWDALIRRGLITSKLPLGYYITEAGRAAVK